LSVINSGESLELFEPMAENHLQLADVIIASLRPQSMNSIPVSVHPVGHELIEKGQ
jgi:hypothetical protein